MSLDEPIITQPPSLLSLRPHLRGLALRCVMGLMYLRKPETSGR